MGKIQKSIRKILLKYDYDKSLWAGDYTDGLRGIMSKKVNNTYTSYLFEGKVIQGFKYYDDYLTQIYGNYMQMPKGDHQRQHNFYYLNLDEPYSIYKEKISFY